MVKKIRLGISIKLAASFVFFAIIIISIIGYLSYTASFDISDTTIHEDLMRHASSIEIQMDYLYGGEIEDVSIHAQNPLIIEYTLALLNNQSLDADAKLKKYLSSYVMLDRDVSSIFIMDAMDGHVIASTDPLFSDAQLSNRSYFTDGRVRPSITVNKYCALEKMILSTVSAPMYHNGSVVAVVAMRLDESKFVDYLNKIKNIGSTGAIYLIDESGIIFSNKPSDTDTQTVLSEGIKRGLQGETGVLEYISHTGTPVVGAYKWVPEYDMLILVESDLAEVHAPMQKLLKYDLIIAIVLFSILFVFIVLFTNYLTTPIKALNTGMKKIKAGDYSTHLKPMYNDELGDLTSSFNEMAEKLQLTIGELESIFTSVDTGIMLVDLDTKILRVNDWIVERFGDLTGDLMRESYTKDSIFYECPVELAIESNESVTVKRVHIINGLKHAYLITASPVHDSTGIAIGVVLVLADITKRLQLEDELRQYSTQLEAMVEDKTKHLSEKLAEIEKMNDLFVGRELVHIETKEKLSEMLEKYADLEEELKQMRSDAQ